jgi:hypothetical protein
VLVNPVVIAVISTGPIVWQITVPIGVGFEIGL